jgi:hypothetical protein
LQQIAVWKIFRFMQTINPAPPLQLGILSKWEYLDEFIEKCQARINPNIMTAQPQ